MTVLVAAGPGTPLWAAELRRALNGERADAPDTAVVMMPDAFDPGAFDPGAFDPGAVEFVVMWDMPAEALRALPNLRAILLTGAGFDHLDVPTLPEVPIVRLVDPAMAADIASYVLSWVIHFQRDFDRFAAASRQADWENDRPARFPRDYVVGVLGTGSIGQVVLDTCAAHGFVTRGWSRSSHDRSLHDFLRDADVVVDVVPLSASTIGLLGPEEFAALGDGVLINVGRGATVNTEALIAALDGELRAAVLDVFDVEPLPSTSALWLRPDVIVTPHIAGRSDPVTGAPIIAANIEVVRAGGLPAAIVNRP